MLNKRFEKIRNEFIRKKPLEAFILRQKRVYTQDKELHRETNRDNGLIWTE